MQSCDLLDSSVQKETNFGNLIVPCSWLSSNQEKSSQNSQQFSSSSLRHSQRPSGKSNCIPNFPNSLALNAPVFFISLKNDLPRSTRKTLNFEIFLKNYFLFKSLIHLRLYGINIILFKELTKTIMIASIKIFQKLNNWKSFRAANTLLESLLSDLEKIGKFLIHSIAKAKKK